MNPLSSKNWKEILINRVENGEAETRALKENITGLKKELRDYKNLLLRVIQLNQKTIEIVDKELKHIENQES